MAKKLHNASAKETWSSVYWALSLALTFKLNFLFLFKRRFRNFLFAEHWTPAWKWLMRIFWGILLAGCCPNRSPPQIIQSLLFARKSEARVVITGWCKMYLDSRKIKQQHFTSLFSNFKSFANEHLTASFLWAPSPGGGQGRARRFQVVWHTRVFLNYWKGGRSGYAVLTVIKNFKF